MSNSREVIYSIPVEHRAPSRINLDLSATLPVERALGLQWCVENDTLGFRVVMKDTPLTQSSVLRTTSSILNPLGHASSFQIRESQRFFFRFFWFKDNDLNGEVEEYEMCVHPFGALSSGACANYALIKTADDGENEFRSDATSTLQRDIYVDNWLKSLSDVSTTVSFVRRSKELCNTGVSI